MKCKNLLYALSLTLIFPSAWGCHLSEQPHNAYQKQGKGVIYIQPTEDYNLPLPEVNFKRLRRMADLPPIKTACITKVSVRMITTMKIALI